MTLLYKTNPFLSRTLRWDYQNTFIQAMLLSVTLLERRRTYWAVFLVSAFMLVLAIIASIFILVRKDVPVFLIEHGVYKVHPIFGIRIPSYMLSMFDVVASVLFSFSISIFILKVFKKTVSAEIFFFCLWVGTVSFEALRLVGLAAAILDLSYISISFFAKLYMGAKFLGLVMIFISGLYASGMRSEKHVALVAGGIGISVFFAAILPVNTGIFGMNLLYRIGYSSMFEGFSFAVILITVINYMLAAKLRSDRAYYMIALGIAGITLSYFLLSLDMTPAVSFLSIITMATGSLLYVIRLHSFYLWQ